MASTSLVPQHAPSPALPLTAATVQQLPHVRTDEDFINRSLLDRIDAEADAEPVSSSDSEVAGASAGGGSNLGGGHGRSYISGSSSQSSSIESPDLTYRYSMGAPLRSESPTQQQQQQLHNLAFMQQHQQEQQRQAQQAEQYIHTPQQSIYNNSNTGAVSDYPGFPENDLQSSSASFDSGPYRSNSMFDPFYGTRNRQNTVSSTTAYGNDSNGPNFGYGLSSADVFGTQSLQSQQQQSQQQMNSNRGFDFVNEQPLKGGNKQLFSNVDPFGTGGGLSGSAILQSHQANKLAQAQQQQQQLAFQNQAPFMNGMLQSQAHSQTPFGPHLSANGVSVSGMGGVSVTTTQEEISTIFVVGFPEDMQVRRFTHGTHVIDGSDVSPIFRNANSRTCSRFHLALKLRRSRYQTKT